MPITSQSDLDTALKTTDGLAVTGFQFQIVTAENAALKPLSDALSQITEGVTITGFTNFGKMSDLK